MMWRMSLLTRAAATLAAASVVLAPTALALSPAHADAPTNPPSQDAFYQYGVAQSAAVAPGTVLDHRDVTLSGISAPAEQLLYRTTDEQGRPSATVTTVINPSGVSKGIVAYLSFYDGLGDSCDPSYTLQGGGGGNPTEKLVINLLLASGYAVTVPDFEGETHDWAAGDESGWSSLDAIRATEGRLGVPASTKVALAGYSGGSIAGEWASELAPTYAPELNLIGTAIGGIPANLAHVMKYADGDTTWAGVIPAAMVSLSRAFGVDFSPYLSAKGLADTNAIKDDCIQQFNTAESGVKLTDLLKPEYADFLKIPLVSSILGHLTMGTAGTPRVPMMMVNGNMDGTGDGVMVAADVKALANKYCQDGLPIVYNELAGKSHTDAGSAFIPAALTYIADRFAGKAAPSTCAPSRPASPTAIHATIKGHSNGKKDVIVVTAKGAAGAKVTITKAGHAKVLGHGVIGANGKVTIKVRDHNGSALTHYRGHVAATAKTSSATTKVLKLR